jgi:hypothetical protein
VVRSNAKNPAKKYCRDFNHHHDRPKKRPETSQNSQSKGCEGEGSEAEV